MKIVCLIDTLNSGGAQRQMVNLVINLKKANYEVTLLYYFSSNHFEDELKNNNINYHLVESSNKLARILKINKQITFINPKVVISFLDIPSFISQIITILRPKIKTIVSERVLEIGKPDLIRRLNRFLYRNVDYITTNSFENKKLILKHNSSFENKIKVIYNSVDFTKFYPIKKVYNNRIIVVANFRPTKNPIKLFKAIMHVCDTRPDLKFNLDWFGHSNNNSKIYLESLNFIQENKLQTIVKIHSPITNIENEYRKSSALILPSFTEGLPNVVCEAMACGLPILISNVSDARNLVEDNVNGFLFNPHSVDEIADSIIKFLELNNEERFTFGINSNKKAINLFSPETYINKYVNLIKYISK